MVDIFKKIDNKEDLTLEELEKVKELILLRGRRSNRPEFISNLALKIATDYDFKTGKYLWY